eukprot:11483848-Heterocapsa_arctica.AAC.1
MSGCPLVAIFKLLMPIMAEESRGGRSAPLKVSRPGIDDVESITGRSAMTRCSLGCVGTGFECGRFACSDACSEI